MGADGGMCWMALREPSKYDRVRQLIGPFWFLTHIDDYYQSNVDWTSDVIIEPKFLIGTYGSFQDYDISETLRDILNPENYDDYLWGDPSVVYGHLTFLELVDDLLTRPLHKGGEWTYLGETWRPARGLGYWIGSNQKYVSLLEEIVWEVVEYAKSEEQRREQLGILADMKVGDWMREMRELLDWTKTGSEETWT